MVYVTLKERPVPAPSISPIWHNPCYNRRPKRPNPGAARFRAWARPASGQPVPQPQPDGPERRAFGATVEFIVEAGG